MTRTLFGALDCRTGRWDYFVRARNRKEDFVAFLEHLLTLYPQGPLLLIVDNYSAHKHPDVGEWLERHPRFHVHFTPTSASWANMVERFFRDITGQRLRRGVFRSVAELEQAIADYLDHHNQQPKPFIWTASASDILEKVKRGRAALENKARSV